METKKVVIVPAGTTEADIAKRIAELTPGEVLQFFFRQGYSMQKGGPLGGGAMTVELNPNYKPATSRHLFLCICWDVDGEKIVGQPGVTFSVGDSKKPMKGAKDLADRVYWRQVER